MAPGHPLQLQGGNKPFLANEAKLVFGSSVRLLSVNWGTSLLIGTNVVTGRNVCSASNATGAELIGFMGTLPEAAMEQAPLSCSRSAACPWSQRLAAAPAGCP